jgi:putative Holliday junction resolvase
MRILGIDFGSKTMGLAITDSSKIIASSLENFEYKNNDLNICISKLKDLFKYYNNDIESIVIGYPLRLNGDKNPNTLLVEHFVELLKSNFPNTKIFLQDERFSTVRATEHLKYGAGLKNSKIKKIKDKMSAVFILDDFLNNY